VHVAEMVCEQYCIVVCRKGTQLLIDHTKECWLTFLHCLRCHITVSLVINICTFSTTHMVMPVHNKNLQNKQIIVSEVTRSMNETLVVVKKIMEVICIS